MYVLNLKTKVFPIFIIGHKIIPCDFLLTPGVFCGQLQFLVFAVSNFFIAIFFLITHMYFSVSSDLNHFNNSHSFSYFLSFLIMDFLFCWALRSFHSKLRTVIQGLKLNYQRIKLIMVKSSKAEIMSFGYLIVFFSKS